MLDDSRIMINQRKMRGSTINVTRNKEVNISRTQVVIQQIMEERQANQKDNNIALEINISAEKAAFTLKEQLQIAVAENDVDKLRVAIE